jgi:hypothetical protein
MGAAALLAARSTDNDVVLPEPVCTLLYVVAIIATIIAFVGLLLSLFGGAAGNRFGTVPVFANWLYAAGVALVAWLLYAFLC